jgi:hypothetical protein
LSLTTPPNEWYDGVPNQDLNGRRISDKMCCGSIETNFQSLFERGFRKTSGM